MSIPTVRAAKFRFEDHCGTHMCRIGQCEERKALWLAWMREAEIWGGYKLDQPGRGYI